MLPYHINIIVYFTLLTALLPVPLPNTQQNWMDILFTSVFRECKMRQSVTVSMHHIEKEDLLRFTQLKKREGEVAL